MPVIPDFKDLSKQPLKRTALKFHVQYVQLSFNLAMPNNFVFVKTSAFSEPLAGVCFDCINLE